MLLKQVFTIFSNFSSWQTNINEMWLET